MKPDLKKPPLSDTVLYFRATRFLAKRNQMLIQRRSRSLGPIFVLDLHTGVVVERGVKDLAALCRRHKLLRPGEVVR